MSAPFNDIGINPSAIDRRGFASCVATVATIKYGMVVIYDTGTTNSRDTKLPAGAAATLVKGVCSDLGDPNASGAFATGEEFACCTDGTTEVLLDAGATAVTKGQPAITSGTAGTVKGWTNETNVDVVGEFTQDYDNSLGSAAVLVAVKLGIFRKT